MTILFTNLWKKNSANTENTRPYELYMPSYSEFAEFFHIDRVCHRYDAD